MSAFVIVPAIRCLVSYEGLPSLLWALSLARHSGESRNPEKKEMHVDKQPAVYILASKRNGTLYTGVTSNLVKRVWEHKNDLVGGFTNRYNVHRLVWYELHDNMESAVTREKRIKGWKRAWKLELIESANPDWQDLYPRIV